MRFEVHKESSWPPSPSPQEERSATNTDGPSHSSREREVGRLREQVAVLQREAEQDNELLHRKDEELHHQRGQDPVHSHS